MEIEEIIARSESWEVITADEALAILEMLEDIELTSRD